MSKSNGHARLPFEESLGQNIVRRMKELGYRPTPGFGGQRIEFSKRYADSEGAVATAWVYFEKPVLEASHVRLANFVVSVQKTLPADLEVVTQTAPEIVKGDLTAVLQAFQHLTGVPARSVDLRVCIRCGRPSADYYIVNGDAVCHTCVEERRRK